MQPMWIILLLCLAVAATVGIAYRHSRKARARHELQEQVHTWEDEGGNVPEVPSVRPAGDKR